MCATSCKLKCYHILSKLAHSVAAAYIDELLFTNQLVAVRGDVRLWLLSFFVHHW